MTTVAAAPSSTAETPRSTLAGNYTDFLKLLMTQLQNQNPTSPLDTNQFTSQLVQFSSVEQQINTNSSLTKLIQATQGNTLLQASSMVGHAVEVSGDQLSLQGGKAGLRFQPRTAQAVTIGVYSQAGVKLREAAVPAGADSWTWDGKGPGGRTMADGAYKVVALGADGKPAAFTVSATATAMQRSGDAVRVSLGGMDVDLSAVTSVR